MMEKKNPEVQKFLDSMTHWKEEFVLLREILLECNLKEEFKWRQPCYSFDGKNISILGNFKDFCCVSFFKGALLKDEEKLLEKPGENSISARIFKFVDTEKISERRETIKAFIYEAIENEKKGLKVESKKVSDFEIPEEFQEILDSDSAVEEAFYSLTPGRQKGYLLHFAGAKQSATRITRIEKYIPLILDGKGIRDCVCGHSNKMPSCDGSHRFL